MSERGKRRQPENEAAQGCGPTPVNGAEVGTLGTASPNKMRDGAADRRCKSLVVIANLLGCEGFTEFHSQHVMKFAKHDPVFGPSFTKKQIAFRAAMRDLPEETRRSIGKFIAAHGEAHFSAGLKIGLITHLTEAERLRKEQADGR